MTGRLPASMTLSLGIHGAALVLFLGLSKEAPKQAARMVEGVDLLVNTPKPRPAMQAPAPLSTMDFLKMALPTVHTAAPAALAVKVPEHHIKLAEAPKLDEKLKRDLGPKLAALDLERQRVDAAKVEAKLENRRQAAATLAAMPRLEDVGRRQVKNLPQALALEERRREVSAAGLSDLAPKAVSRRQASAAMATLQEAAPAAEERAPRKGLASFLPEERLEIKPQAAPASAPRLAKIDAAPPKLSRRQVEASVSEAKKGVEIEGPLADRRVEASDIPSFPAWAHQQGILEAAVSIRFTVNAEGAVMPGMRVERTSGYGRLDKLAMESLKNWRFVQRIGSGVQWGVITFRFVLE